MTDKQTGRETQKDRHILSHLTGGGPVGAVVAAVVVLFSRIPLLGFDTAGYGRDPDAWRLVGAAQSIAATGRYSLSRPPGYPLVEYGYTLLLRNPELLLIAVAVASSLAAALLVLIIRRLGGRDPVIAAIAFAFTPVVFINSTNAMDYLWALTSILVGYYLVLDRRMVGAGIFVGLATCCRLTSAAMLIPFSLLVLERPGGNRVRVVELSRLLLPAVVVAAGGYALVFANEGPAMFAIADDSRPTHHMLEVAGDAVWGDLGVLAILVGILSVAGYPFLRMKLRTSIPRQLPTTHGVVWLLIVYVYAMAFVRLPHEAGYLAIIVPFVILSVARYAHAWVFRLVCVLLIVSPFVDLDRSDVFYGPLAQNRSSRIAYMDASRAILDGISETGSERTVVVAGWLAPQLTVLETMRARGHIEGDVIFMETIDDSTLTTRVGHGYDVYVVPLREVHRRPQWVHGWLARGAQMLKY